MVKVLVTGANGQLGSEIKELAANKSPNISVIYIDIDELDLTNYKDVKNYLKNDNFDWIINCAAYTAVDKA